MTIKKPQITAVNPEQQIRQLTSYCYQLADQLEKELNIKDREIRELKQKLEGGK